ncbi:isochorismatase family protein [Bradyrhizobium sp. HKCCYLS2058]|uniref:isochorismatase family protein n=1 Tax=unclassified Bradyrhizobium TaxID=2631580 RepID=UPI003EBFBC6E
MALTQLDLNTALIVVDLQKGIVGASLLHPIGEVIARASALAERFRALRLPVVLVNVAGTAPGRTERPPRLTAPFPADWADLIPELNRQPHDIVVTKRTWGAFASTDLETRLKARDVTQVVVAGVATGTGVESTARQAYEQGFNVTLAVAYEQGFNVTLAVDAMTDTRPEAHQYSLTHVFPRLGETGTSADIIRLLDARTPLT